MKKVEHKATLPPHGRKLTPEEAKKTTFERFKEVLKRLGKQ